MLLSPTLEHVVAWSPTFHAVSIQKVVVGQMASDTSANCLHADISHLITVVYKLRLVRFGHLHQ